jgi:quinol monooxygenase YgiN
MGLVAVVVEFVVAVDRLHSFLELITENARESLRSEPGCLQFDVAVPRLEEHGQSNVLLYEVYADDAAFAAHLKTPHYGDFACHAEPLLRSKRVRRLEIVWSHIPPLRQTADIDAK